MPYLKGVLAWGWPVLVACWICLRITMKRFPGGVAGVWRADRPVFWILIIPSLIFLASPLLGVWTYHLIILTHFIGWYFYASRRLARAPKQSRRRDGVWKWVRGSVAGFQTLHIGAAIVFSALILVSYLFPADLAPLNIFVNSKAFYYWTIIHVTVSFAPRM